MQDITQFKKHPVTFYTLFHMDTGLKIDLWFDESSDFSSKWSRRKDLQIEKENVSLVSVEDLILTKLSWCKELMSERHMRDCVGMWMVQKGKLDEKYLFGQAKKRGLTKLLSQVIHTKEY